MEMDEEVQRLPSLDEWLDTPIDPSDWPGENSPPDKREVFDWLEDELGIQRVDTRYGLLHNILFSASWLIQDEKTRPPNKELTARLSKIEKRASEILSIIEVSDKNTDLDGWTKRYLRSAEIQTNAREALESIRRNLEALRMLTNEADALVKKSKSGRRKDEALWDWVEALSMHIEVFTEIPIKVAFHNGEPITPYARLIYKAVGLLDPDRLPKLENALERYRTAHNQSKKTTN